MSSLQLYDDIKNSDLGEKVIQLQNHNEKLIKHITGLENDIAKLCNELTQMKKTKDNLENNISQLFNTAKIESQRKDRMISELQKQLDDLLFKRRTRQFSSRKDECTKTDTVANKRPGDGTSLEYNNNKRQKYNSDINSSEELSQKIRTTKANSRSSSKSPERSDDNRSQFRNKNSCHSTSKSPARPEVKHSRFRSNHGYRSSSKSPIRESKNYNLSRSKHGGRSYSNSPGRKDRNKGNCHSSSRSPVRRESHLSRFRSRNVVYRGRRFKSRDWNRQRKRSREYDRTRSRERKIMHNSRYNSRKRSRSISKDRFVVKSNDYGKSMDDNETDIKKILSVEDESMVIDLTDVGRSDKPQNRIKIENSEKSNENLLCKNDNLDEVNSEPSNTRNDQIKTEFNINTKLILRKVDEQGRSDLQNDATSDIYKKLNARQRHRNVILKEINPDSSNTANDHLKTVGGNQTADNSGSQYRDDLQNGTVHDSCEKLNVNESHKNVTLKEINQESFNIVTDIQITKLENKTHKSGIQNYDDLQNEITNNVCRKPNIYQQRFNKINQKSSNKMNENLNKTIHKSGVQNYDDLQNEITNNVCRKPNIYEQRFNKINQKSSNKVNENLNKTIHKSGTQDCRNLQNDSEKLSSVKLKEINENVTNDANNLKTEMENKTNHESEIQDTGDLQTGTIIINCKELNMNQRHKNIKLKEIFGSDIVDASPISKPETSNKSNVQVPATSPNGTTSNSSKKLNADRKHKNIKDLNQTSNKANNDLKTKTENKKSMQVLNMNKSKSKIKSGAPETAKSKTSVMKIKTENRNSVPLLPVNIKKTETKSETSTTAKLEDAKETFMTTVKEPNGCNSRQMSNSTNIEFVNHNLSSKMSGQVDEKFSQINLQPEVKPPVEGENVSGVSVCNITNRRSTSAQRRRRCVIRIVN